MEAPDKRLKLSAPASSNEPAENEDSFTIEKENSLMRSYYSLQLEFSADEFQRFWETLQTPLPTTFRINPMHSTHENLINQLKSPDFLSSLIDDSLNPIQIEPVPWYPNSLSWQISTKKSRLKYIEGIKPLQTFLQNANDCGLISRQELVSMIPGLVLDVSPGMHILDMCAAPGSKTAHIIELMKGQGLIVANDVDFKRANTLVHQLHRTNINCLVVTNHPAQHYPGIGPKQSRYQFDRVLCDVPCSGDGAIRKCPDKWRSWKISDSYGLHKLQTLILNRGFSLCKPGGFFCYSTCSLNPIENEAVVSEMLRQHPNDIEIVDLHGKLREICPGFIVRPGLGSWKVVWPNEEGSLIEYSSMSEVPESIKSIKSSMFPVGISEDLQKCARIFPHDQNTGGFFVTLFHKIGPIHVPRSPNPAFEDQKSSEMNTGGNKVFIELDEDSSEYQSIKEYYGYQGEPTSQLYTMAGSKMNTIFYVSKEVKDFIEGDKKKSLKVVSLGVKAFIKHNLKSSGSICKYKPVQDALPYISKLFSKRKVNCKDTEFLKTIVNEKFVLQSCIKDEECQILIRELGFYIIRFVEIEEEVIVLKCTEDKIIPMIPKEHEESLKMRYLSI
ncbi:unnamed protein product [Blepharisma stoltei]|uniref:SAM-dependent MTase RsmB/NOP-type domain-containing protein n=1 Tax=Blepharisma stoltei TaxID=1481888 RepID=A0AAU9JDF3_9CILI|nr:unnamed protein product [Blepharisma stoltei]